MQAYLASKYMSGPKADAILSRVTHEKKKKKRKTAEISAACAMIVDEDGGWDGRQGTQEDGDDDLAEAVVASDRSFKKRRTVEKDAEAEASGWSTVREGIKTEPSPPPPDEQPQIVESSTTSAGGLVSASEMKKRLQKQTEAERKRKGSETAEEREEARIAQETVYRDATGRKIDTKAERAEAARKKREHEEREAQKMEWGKGLVQREDKAARTAQLERERKRDLAVYADDRELNDGLKAQERWNDPAAQFLTVCPLHLFCLIHLTLSIYREKKTRVQESPNTQVLLHLPIASASSQGTDGMVSIAAMASRRSYFRSKTNGNERISKVTSGAWTTCKRTWRLAFRALHDLSARGQFSVENGVAFSNGEVDGGGVPFLPPS